MLMFANDLWTLIICLVASLLNVLNVLFSKETFSLYDFKSSFKHLLHCFNSNQESLKE